MRRDRNLVNVFCVYVIILWQIRTILTTSGVDYDKKFGRVIHVSAIFRHGDRTPTTAYPLDPYLNYSWPDGYGQLTQKGQQRAYDRGKWFRKRYSQLVRKISSHTNISMRSSDRDRTIMSAQLLLAGLYLPKPNHTVDRSLLWHPIPVHTIPSQYDNVLALRRKCPMADKLIEMSYATQKVKNLYDKYAREFRYMRKHSGYAFTRANMLNTNQKVVTLYDTLSIERNNGLKLPSWTHKIFPHKLFHIRQSLDYKGIHNYKLQRLYSGPLLELLILEMQRNINGTSRSVFNFYSGHDYVLAFFMATLGIHNGINPPFSATLVFELRETKLHEKIVTVSYKNSTKTVPYFLEIPKCKTPCKFEKFVRVAKRFIPTDWEEECRDKTK